MRSALWLVPTTAYREELRRLIEGLALETHGPIFEPHITLLRGVFLPPGEMERRLAGFTFLVKALFVESIEIGVTRHQCVSLKIRRSEALMDLHESVAARLGMEPSASFAPHISVVYGDLAPGTRAVLAKDPRVSKWCGRIVPAGDLEAWSTGGPEAAWRRVF